MTSKVEICNLAISHLGSGKEIANLDTDKSQEAAACRRFYEVTKTASLKAIDWPFATSYFTLNLIEAQPDNEWAFSYRYPVGCLNMRRVLSGTRNDTRDSRVPYKFVKDGSGKLIYCDQEEAVIEYTEDITDPTYFTPEFVLAFSFRLAAYIAPRITGGDPFKLKQEMLTQYKLEVDEAKKQAFNEQRDELEPESEFIRARS